LPSPRPSWAPGDEPGDVEEFDRDVPDAVVTAVVTTPLLAVYTGTAGTDGRHAAIRVDSSKRVVGDVDVGHRRGGVERRLAGVRLAGQCDRDHV